MNALRMFVVPALLLTFSAPTFAADPAPAAGQKRGPNPEMFQKMKAKMLENHQKRIQIMQSAESCIQAATDSEQLKSCHEQERQADQQMRQQNKQEREVVREGRQSRQDQDNRK